MKYFFVFIIIAVISCTAVQKPTTPIVFQPQKPTENINDYVPFTRALYNEIKGKVDINKVRFFISNSVVLNRGTVKNEISVGNNGELQSSSQTNEKIIELLALTPGVVESIDAEGMMIRFEQGDKKTLRFINNKYSPVYFSLSGNNWKNGTAFVDYANTSYLASCADCNSLSNVKLLVKKLSIETNSKEVIQVTGINPQ